MEPGGLLCHMASPGGASPRPVSRSPAPYEESPPPPDEESRSPSDEECPPPVAGRPVPPVVPLVASASASPAASALAPSDGSLDSVALAGISLTRTVPSSSPRPVPVTGGGCPQYPALRRRTTRCSRSQHGPDGFRSRLRQHFQSSNQPTPRRITPAEHCHWPEPVVRQGSNPRTASDAPACARACGVRRT